MAIDKTEGGRRLSAAPGLSRRSAVAPFLAMDVLSAAKVMAASGEHVIHMELGEPGSPAPERVRSAVKAALDRGPVGYTQALGIPSLRVRIARHYAETYGVDVSPERVVVTTGSSAGFVLAFVAAFDAGARVAIAAPGYPAYRNILSALDIESVELETGPQSRYALTADMVAAAHEQKPLDGVLVMSPANPTGVMMSTQALRDLALICEALGIWFVSDEIYHGLTYERPADTALQFSYEAIIVNSFSKFFCMTGWRVGWLIVPERMVRPLERLTQNLYISAPYLSQVAAEAAFDAQDELLSIRNQYARNRAYLIETLPQFGFGSFLPVDGAFYVYVDVSRLTNDTIDFCQRALREAKVAITPGVDFDPVNGHKFVRLSFAGSEESVREGCKRLRVWVTTRGR